MRVPAKSYEQAPLAGSRRTHFILFREVPLAIEERQKEVR
jgi:hypothetical protein